MSFDKMIGIFLSYILTYISYIPSQKKKIFWVSNSRLTQSLINIYHISFQRTFCMKLREQGLWEVKFFFFFASKFHSCEKCWKAVLYIFLWLFDSQNQIVILPYICYIFPCKLFMRIWYLDQDNNLCLISLCILNSC